MKVTRFRGHPNTALEANAFRRAVYAKLSADVAIRLGCAEQAVLKRMAYPNVMLMCDYKDYASRHPDGQPRVVTMTFCLPSKGAPDDLATSIHVKRLLAHQLNGLKFKEIKRFPSSPTAPLR
jgi:hypothetical protein